MSKRNVPFVNGEFYHCFNRGVDKREIFIDAKDFHYFLTVLDLFNQLPSRGDLSHYKQDRRNKIQKSESPIVSAIAYCLNPNHFHLLLRQEVEDGISKYLQKISTGYTMYFNKKYKRSGSLFQGKFKSVHVTKDTQLKHLFAYVTSNNLIHDISDDRKFRSSYTEVVERQNSKICNLRLINSIYEDNLIKLVSDGVQLTKTYRKNIEVPEKSEFLE